MKNVVVILVAAFAFLALGFVVAERAGWMEESRVRGWIVAAQLSPGGRIAAAGAVFGLLAADLALPVPSSVVMTLSGALLGVATGTVVSFAGAMTSALIGFGLCRRFGRRAFARMVGASDEARVDRFLRTYGAWGILLSRSVPMLTEVISCFAGLGSLSFRRFAGLTAAGTLPLCAVYAWAGSRGDANGFGWAVLLAFVLPALGFAFLRWFERRRIGNR